MDPGLDGHGLKIMQTTGKPRVKVKLSSLLWMLPAAFLFFFFLVPLGNILLVMATRSGVVSTNAILQPLWFTIWQAALSMLLTLALGLPAAFVFARYNFAGKGALRLLTTLPFILPTVVVAAGFTALLGPRGLVNGWLMQAFNLQNPPIDFMNTLGAILIAHVFYNTSVVIRVVGSALVQFDPRIEEAGRVLGGSPWRVFREVTLPLLRPSILVAALMVFLFDFTSFGVILLLGGPRFATLEVSIYTQTLSMLNLRMAGLLSFIQLACTIGITLLYTRLNGKRSVPLMPRLRGETVRTPKSIFEKTTVGLMVAVLIVLLVSPLAALALKSVLQTDAATQTSNLTLAYYKELFINRNDAFFYVPPAKAALNSLFYAAVTVLISVGLGLTASYALVRQRGLKRWLDPLIMLPLGTSAVTLGLGFLITFNKPPLDVSSFPLLIPLAHSLVALPFVVRTIQPALASIPASLGESAASLGASPWWVWREVELPIIRRAVMVGVIFSFTLSLGEFGATSFLARPDTPTLPVAIYRFLSQPGAMNYGQAMAMATLLMLVCALAIGLLDKLQVEGRGSVNSDL
ncbi:MAG: iron ABC transporter permease [Chloroflexi bacterium HGW-Chloroflexi-5]|nr:MAG: iron ABC transporter permease [Chloroflexi bacterium HGW-Chloroflexi-5]